MRSVKVYGLKLLCTDDGSLTRNYARIMFKPDGKWHKAPGVGVFLAVTDGLTAGGPGPRIAAIEGRNPNKAILAPAGVVVCREYRCLAITADTYQPKRDALDAEYRTKRAALDAEHRTKRDALYRQVYREIVAKAKRARKGGAL